jgi:hypothetical protein
MKLSAVRKAGEAVKRLLFKGVETKTNQMIVEGMKDVKVPMERGWKHCELLLEKLSKDKFAFGIPHSVSSTWQIRTPYSNLGEYLNALEVILFSINQQQLIPKSHLTFLDNPQVVEHWMISSDGYYLGVKELLKFFDQVEQLVLLAGQLEQEEIGVDARNSRLLYPFFAQLRDTLTDLHGLQSAL